jgi:CHAT domain-containing protein
MKPLVLHIRKVAGQAYAMLEVTPDGGAVSQDGASLNLSQLSPCRDHHTTDERGQDLTNRLAADPDIGRALRFVQNLHAQNPGAVGPPQMPKEMFPIFVDLGPPDADNLPWEALWSEAHKQPLSLLPYWPVVRRGKVASPVGQLDIRWESELRILAILAAAQIDAMPEWKALRTAIEKHGGWVRVKVLTPQKEIIDEITAAGMPNVTVEVIAGKDDILSAARLFRPHILHCFAHGQAATNPRLLVATPSTWKSGENQVALDSPEFDEFGASNTLWLTTINACAGSQGQWDARSFARNVIARGTPVVVGMSDLLPANVSHLFTRKFFSELLSRLWQYGGKHPNERVTEEAVVEHLCGSLYTARRGMHDEESKDIADCMLPVMYLGERFRFTIVPTDDPETATPNHVTPPPGRQPSDSRSNRVVLSQEERALLKPLKLELAVLEQSLLELQATGMPDSLRQPLRERVQQLREQVKDMVGSSQT